MQIALKRPYLQRLQAARYSRFTPILPNIYHFFEIIEKFYVEFGTISEYNSYICIG